MSMTFTKLFSSITESTVWCEPAGTRLAWITMLAMADRQGRVFASVPGLANRARITLLETEQAIQTFLAPDPYSRTPDYDGRRIAAIDGGWRLLNYSKYRQLRDEGATRELKRDHMRRVRAERTEALHSGMTHSTVECCGDNAEAEAETETETEKTTSEGHVAQLALPSWLPIDLWRDWHQYRSTRRGWTHKARALSLRSLTELQAQGHDPRAVIEQSIENGWAGLFPLRRQASNDKPARPKASDDFTGATYASSVTGEWPEVLGDQSSSQEAPA